MNIWEERYTDERYGLEQKSSFRYFQKYLQQKYPRSIKKLAEELAEELAERKRPPSYKTLTNFSHKWKWRHRAEAYDQHLKELHFKTKEKEVMEWESEQLTFARARAKYHMDTMQKIHQADEKKFPLTKKPYAEEANERAYNQSIESVYKILHGGIIKSENHNSTNLDVDADVKQEIKEHKTIEEKNKENDEYFKQLERDMAKE